MKKRILRCKRIDKKGKRCNHTWESRHNPKTCPKCRSAFWNIEPVRFTCKRCGYEWTSRKENGKPQTCSKCGTRFWDK